MKELSFAADIRSLPPQSVDAEEAILGGILLDPEAISRVADCLIPDAFYFNDYRLIYKAAIALHGQDKPTDLMTVTVWLADHNQLDAVGGQAKLAQLVECTVSAVNIDRYAALVMEKYQRRQSISIGNELTDASYDTTIELGEVLETAEEKIFRLREGQSSDRYQLEDAGEMVAPLWKAIEEGKHAGKQTSWSDLDCLTGGLHRKTITIIGADSHMGKTSFMVGLAHEILTYLNEPVLFFSCEMSKEQLNPRLLARLSGIDSSRLIKGGKEGGLRDSEWIAIGEAIALFGQLPWMVYDEPSPSLTTIRSVVKQAIRKHGSLGGVFLDYIQLLSLGGHNRVQELGELTRQLRAIAKDFDFPFFASSQVNREVGKRNDKRAGKNDLRDSGEIGEGADLIMMLYREAHYKKNGDKKIEIILDKNRPYGRLGTATMLVDLQTCHFRQMDNRYTSTTQEKEDW